MKKISIAFLLVSSISTSAFSAEYYKVEVKRVNQDLYKAIGTNYHIVTRFCHVYTYGEGAILKIDSSFGYNIGSIVFDNGTKCDVEKII